MKHSYKSNTNNAILLLPVVIIALVCLVYVVILSNTNVEQIRRNKEPLFQLHKWKTKNSARKNFHKLQVRSLHPKRVIREVSESVEEDLKTNDIFVAEFLVAANKYRAIHGAPKLKRNETLMKESEEWASNLAKQSDEEKMPVFKYSRKYLTGESIWGGRHFEEISGTNVATKWYSECSHHDWSTNFYSPHSSHFTQLVWKDTEIFGIAKIISPKEKIAIIVARYLPTGNLAYHSSFKANVLPAISRGGEKCFVPTKSENITTYAAPSNPKRHKIEKIQKKGRQFTRSRISNNTISHDTNHTDKKNSSSTHAHEKDLKPIATTAAPTKSSTAALESTSKSSTEIKTGRVIRKPVPDVTTEAPKHIILLVTNPANKTGESKNVTVIHPVAVSFDAYDDDDDNDTSEVTQQARGFVHFNTLSRHHTTTIPTTTPTTAMITTPTMTPTTTTPTTTITTTPSTTPITTPTTTLTTTPATTPETAPTTTPTTSPSTIPTTTPMTSPSTTPLTTSGTTTITASITTPAINPTTSPITISSTTPTSSLTTTLPTTNGSTISTTISSLNHATASMSVTTDPIQNTTITPATVSSATTSGTPMIPLRPQNSTSTSATNDTNNASVTPAKSLSANSSILQKTTPEISMLIENSSHISESSTTDTPKVITSLPLLAPNVTETSIQNANNEFSPISESEPEPDITLDDDDDPYFEAVAVNPSPLVNAMGRSMKEIRTTWAPKHMAVFVTKRKTTSAPPKQKKDLKTNETISSDTGNSNSIGNTKMNNIKIHNDTNNITSSNIPKIPQETVSPVKENKKLNLGRKLSTKTMQTTKMPTNRNFVVHVEETTTTKTTSSTTDNVKDMDKIDSDVIIGLTKKPSFVYFGDDYKKQNLEIPDSENEIIHSKNVRTDAEESKTVGGKGMQIKNGRSFFNTNEISQYTSLPVQRGPESYARNKGMKMKGRNLQNYRVEGNVNAKMTEDVPKSFDSATYNHKMYSNGNNKILQFGRSILFKQNNGQSSFVTKDAQPTPKPSSSIYFP